MPEALERWPVALIARILPRHMQIIERLDGRFLGELRDFDGSVDADQVRLIDGGGQVRMAHLAFVGSHRVNGVSALHTDLMKQTVFRGLHQVYPERIVNQTNGITPRRWLHDCNRPLAGLLKETIGDRWVADLERIEALEPHAADPGFRAAFAAAKLDNKCRLAAEIERRVGIVVDPGALFDVHIKRLHEYKRQLLNILGTIAHYHAIRRQPDADWLPRLKVFAGKAAPGYVTAKLIIKLINDVARVINADPVVGDRLRVVYLPNYNVSLAELIIPAADLSEQISTAGMEASGTGNMKLALNGALTVGTLDGANVEIRERVGADNIFIFGLTADEVVAWRHAGHAPQALIDADPALREAIEAIDAGLFSPTIRTGSARSSTISAATTISW